MATTEQIAAAEAGASVVAVPKGKEEKLGFGMRDKEGNLVVQSAKDARTTASNRTGDTVAGGVPAGAEFGIHGHIDAGPRASESFVDDPRKAGGFGDTQSLALKNPMVMFTVSKGQVARHEIQGGQLTFTFPKGSMVKTQTDKMQLNLDKEQLKFKK